MTFCTVINPAGMIKCSISEIHCVMADAAVFSVRGRMSCGHSPGAGCNIIRTAVMARCAIAGDARVTEDRWSEAIVRVANVTILDSR